MADSATVRAWASQQDPPLAAPAPARGRFAKDVVAAFNTAHPDDVYVPAGKPQKAAAPTRDLDEGDSPDGSTYPAPGTVTPPPTADTVSDALRPEDSFTSTPEAAESVTGELVSDGVREAVEQAQDDAEQQSTPSRYAHILPVNPPASPHEYDTEQYTDAP